MSVNVKTLEISNGACWTKGYYETFHESSNIYWKANLRSKNDKSLVKSPIYKLNHGTLNESEWQVILNTGHVDDYGTKYISFYLHMLQSQKDVEMSFCITLPGDSGRFETGIIVFSKNTPVHGFEKFLPLYRTQSVSVKDPNLELNVALHIIGRKDEFEEDEFEEVDFKQIEPLIDVPTVDKAQSDQPKEIETDGTISNGKIDLPVNTSLLSACSPVFETFYREHDEKDIVLDVGNDCPSRSALKQVVEFCHFGTLKLPKPSAMLWNLMDAARKLEIQSLLDKVQERYLKKMTIPKFDLAVKFVLTNVFKESTANPVLADFLMANFEELKNNEIFQESFEEYLSYYKKLLLDDDNKY